MRLFKSGEKDQMKPGEYIAVNLLYVLIIDYN